MGRTKAQRETRDFSMALVINTIKITITTNTQIFLERDQDLLIYFCGGSITFYFVFTELL
jgi:hypothetical protein